MFSKVSWGEFAMVIGTSLVLYYIILGLKYFRKEITALLTGKLSIRGKASDKGVNEQEPYILSDTSFDELEAVVNDLRYAILERNGKQASKEELLVLLQERLSGYMGLQNAAYRVAINNYIITNAKELCGVVFSEDELNTAWDALPR